MSSYISLFMNFIHIGVMLVFLLAQKIAGRRSVAIQTNSDQRRSLNK